MSRTKGKQLVATICLVAFYAFVIGYGLYTSIRDSDSEILRSVCFIIGFLCFGAILLLLGIRSEKNNKKFYGGLHAEHKLITSGLTVVDIGNFRFIYRTYVKSMSPLAKIYLSMEVDIPFPKPYESIGNRELAEPLLEDLKGLVSSIEAEGKLTGRPAILDLSLDNSLGERPEVTWIGQPLRFEFLKKAIDTDYLVSIQSRVLDVIDKHNLQDVRYCTITGTDDGTEYKHFSGNIQDSTVFSNHTNSTHRMTWKAPAACWMHEYTDLFDINQYQELFDASTEFPVGYKGGIGHLEETINGLFRGSAHAKAKVENVSEGFSVRIEVLKDKTIRVYSVIQSDGYWWVLIRGLMDEIYPVSMTDESSACDFLLGLITRYR